MTEKYLFADVDLPFHVWVKEGARWVLRDAKPRMQPQRTAPRMGEGAMAGDRRSATRPD
jgi:hypothetical protein